MNLELFLIDLRAVLKIPPFTICKDIAIPSTSRLLLFLILMETLTLTRRTFLWGMWKYTHYYTNKSYAHSNYWHFWRLTLGLYPRGRNHFTLFLPGPHLAGHLLEYHTRALSQGHEPCHSVPTRSVPALALVYFEFFSNYIFMTSSSSLIALARTSSIGVNRWEQWKALSCPDVSGIILSYLFITTFSVSPKFEYVVYLFFYDY